MFYYDVTIIKVKTPFYITSKVKPIQLAKRGFDPEGKTFIYDKKTINANHIFTFPQVLLELGFLNFKLPLIFTFCPPS
jgi:hypothetical protein